MMFADHKVEISKSKIEKNARNYGMHYENECKVIFDKGDEK